MIRTASRRPDMVAALALLALYVAVMSGHSYSIDGVLMFRQAVSIAHDFSLHFAQPVHWGGVYWTSKYGIGLSLIYVPGVKILGLLGIMPAAPMAVAFDGNLFYGDPVYAIVGGSVHVVVAAVTALLVARLVTALGFGEKTSLLAMASYGLASPAIVYAKGDFAQPLLGLCLVVGLLALVRFRKSQSLIAVGIAAIALVLGVLARPVEGSFLMPAWLLMLLPSWNPRLWRLDTYSAIFMILAAYALAVGATLAVDWGRYGTPFETGYGRVSWGTPIWIGLPGVLISPARGIIWEFPLVVLAPLGVWRLWTAEIKVVAAVVSGLVLALLLNTALFIPWWGGWNWGSRLFVPALPVVAVAAAIGAERLRPTWRTWLVPVLFAGGVFWALPGIFTDLLGGYAAMYDGSSQSFVLSGYAPIGGLRFLHHLRAVDLGDSHSIDILWFRIARQTHDISIAVPFVLGLLSAFLAWRALANEPVRTSEASLQTS